VDEHEAAVRGLGVLAHDVGGRGGPGALNGHEVTEGGLDDRGLPGPGGPYIRAAIPASDSFCNGVTSGNPDRRRRWYSGPLGRFTGPDTDAVPAVPVAPDGAGAATCTTPFAIINVRQQYLRSWRRGFQYASRATIDQTRGGLTATVITAPVQGLSGLQHQIRPHDGLGSRTSAVRRLGRPAGDFGNDPEQQ
jgi:hypothetical protein